MPEQVIRSIMTLCPGGPVGAVMRREGRVLLPRLMTIKRVVIERRGRGVQLGRIIVVLSPAASGTVVTIRSGVHPIALAMAFAFIAVLALGVAWYAGRIAGVVVAALLAGAEAVWWRKGAAAVKRDADWLARELPHADGSLQRSPRS
jgi:hypothetical protein